jgi:hypothetical protein
MEPIKFTLAAVLVMLMVSCGGNKKQEEQSDDTFDLEAYIEAAEAIEPDLNTVQQVFNILEMVNAEYYDVLTNDPYSAHSYKTTYPVGAANLGVYMADILYHLYGDAQESMYLTFAAAQELARYIGIESEFGSWTIENLEGTLEKRETITKLFNSLLEDSEKYNSEQEMVFIHTAFLAGSFIEKVFITGNLLKQKMTSGELTKEQESDIRELLVIYLNQLDPSTSVLYDAFEKQQEMLSGIVILSTFERLKALSTQLKEVKSSLAVAPISEIASNPELNATFELLSELRTGLVTASS